jgi:hypothetical protein
MTDARWTAARPALGEVIVRLLALRARLDRIEARRRLQAIEKTAKLLGHNKT